MDAASAQGSPALLNSKKPFAQTARIYFDKGWLPMPLPARKKSKPPEGYTGWENDAGKINLKQVDAWLGSVPSGANISMRPRPDQIGIDVDAHKSPEAKETWAKILADLESLGGLPPTWTSSAQDDGGSGIRHYRLAKEHQRMAWPGTIGDALQFVHFGHRYAVLPPSVHPEPDNSGSYRHYKWYRPGQDPIGAGSYDYPDVGDLPILPAAVVEYFTKGKYHTHLPEKDLGSVAESKKKVAAWIQERSGDPCAAMIKATEDITDEFEGAAAHDTMRSGFYRLACLSAEGHPGLAEAVSRLHDYFIAEVSRDDRDGETRGMAQAEQEWLRARDSGVKKVMHRMEQNHFIGSACTCTGLTPEGKPKERIDVEAYYLPEALAICYDAVRAREDTGWLGLYHLNGQLREVTDQGMRELSVNSLRPVVARRVDWIKWRGVEDIVRAVPVNPTKEFLGSMLEDSTIVDELPPIKAVVKTPFWAKVGNKTTLVHENGYHRDVQVVMNMDPRLAESVEKMDLDPSAKWVRRAIDIIDDMIEKFPFVADADRAAFYAALILPFVRDLIPGPTPIHLIGAPVHGSGKTLLAKAISMVACGTLGESGNGYSLISVSKTRDGNAELEKEIATRMRSTPRVMVIDNIAHTIDSSKIASQITEYPNFVNRLMGGNNEINVPNRSLWIMTANNPTASDEIADRIVPIWIDPHCERPRDRTDDFKDLYSWIPANRPALVWAALTLVAHWVASGAEDGPVHLGSFDRWASVVSGILDCSGIEGLLDNRKEFLDSASDDTGMFVGVVHQWAGQWPDQEVRAADLLTLPAMEELLDVHSSTANIRLGKLIKPFLNRVVGGFTLKRRTKDGVSLYSLEKDQS